MPVEGVSSRDPMAGRLAYKIKPVAGAFHEHLSAQGTAHSLPTPQQMRAWVQGCSLTHLHARHGPRLARAAVAANRLGRHAVPPQHIGQQLHALVVFWGRWRPAVLPAGAAGTLAAHRCW